MYGTLDIPASGLVAQRTRMTVIAANLANRDSLIGPDGEYDPYRRRFAVFMEDARGGVEVAEIREDDSALERRYEPNSPFADDEGYVLRPNVNSVVEQMDAMAAQRAYDANITVAEGLKTMMSTALRLIA